MEGKLKPINVIIGHLDNGLYIQKYQSDYAETNVNSYAYIKNKPNLDLKQDVITDLATIRAGAALGATAVQDVSNKQDVIADLATIRAGAALGATALQTHQDISGKQDKLTAGNNISIVNNVISATGGGGEGTVKSVNGISPDSAGNVAFSEIGVNVTPDMDDKYSLYYVSEDAEGVEVATADDIDRLDGDIANCSSAITKVGNNVETLKKMAKGILYEYQTDSTEAYSKSIPAGAKVMDLNMLQSGKSFVENHNFGFGIAIGQTVEQNGITLARNNDGSFTVGGTATDSVYISLSASSINNIGLVSGHSYYIRGLEYASASASTYRIFIDNIGTHIKDKVYTFNGTNLASGNCRFTCASGITVPTTTFFLQLVDMTVFDNSKTYTVDECKAILPIYTTKVEPTLTDVAVDKVVVQGKNLFNQNDFRDTTKWTNNDVGQPLYKLDVVNGLSYTFNYTNLTSITNTFVYLYKYPRGNKTDYTRVSYVLANSSIVKNIKFTAEDCDYYLWANNTISQATAISLMDNIQLELGTTATAYTPYIAPTTITIPTTLAQGKSAGTVYDTNEFYSVEQEDGTTKYYCKHTQRVGSVDLGELTFTTVASDDTNKLVSCIIDGIYTPLVNGNVISSKYSNATGDMYTSAPNMTTTVVANANTNSMLHNSKQKTRLFLKLPLADAPQGILNYALAEPIETITELSQNLFEALTVEGGGSITFVGNNANYNLPMANKEEYLVYLNEV